jgi:hypothetical protein
MTNLRSTAHNRANNVAATKCQRYKSLAQEVCSQEWQLHVHPKVISRRDPFGTLGTQYVLFPGMSAHSVSLMKTLTILLVVISNFAVSQRRTEDFLIAESLAIRLSPSAFHMLPKRIIEVLEQGGYTIPQSWADSLPHNVISGEFRKPGQLDWAVLASKNHQSSIIIFWNGSDTDTTHLEQLSDLTYMQDEASSGILFSRYIQTVRLNEFGPDCGYQETTLPRVDHDAIEDYFIPKGSLILYFYQGKLYDCPGAD